MEPEDITQLLCDELKEIVVLQKNDKFRILCAPPFQQGTLMFENTEHKTLYIVQIMYQKCIVPLRKHQIMELNVRILCFPSTKHTFKVENILQDVNDIQVEWYTRYKSLLDGMFELRCASFSHMFPNQGGIKNERLWYISNSKGSMFVMETVPKEVCTDSLLLSPSVVHWFDMDVLMSFRFYTRPGGHGLIPGKGGFIGDWQGMVKVRCSGSKPNRIEHVSSIIPITPIVIIRDQRQTCTGLWMDVSMSSRAGVILPLAFSKYMNKSDDRKHRLINMKKMFRKYQECDQGDYFPIIAFESFTTGSFVWAINYLDFSGECGLPSDFVNYIKLLCLYVRSKHRHIVSAFINAISNPRYSLCTARLKREYLDLAHTQDHW
jgi:hypothetical protein